MLLCVCLPCFCASVWHRYVRGMCAAARIQQQDSRAAGQRQPCFKLFCVCAVAMVCVVGAQQEVEARQHFHVQCTNQTHIVGPHTRYTKHTAVAKAGAHTNRWNALFPLFDLRRPRDIKTTPSQRGMLCGLYSSCKGFAPRAPDAARYARARK